MDVEEDIKRYDIELTEEESVSTLEEVFGKIEIRGEQLYRLKIAIKNILAEREEDKKKIAELEAKLEFYQWGDLDNLKFEEYMKEFIPKQKVKEALEDIEDYFDRLNGPDEDMKYIRNKKKELLEEK